MDELFREVADGDRHAAERLAEIIEAEIDAASMLDAIWIKHRHGPAPWTSHRPRTGHPVPTEADVSVMVDAADMLDDLDVWE